MGTWFVDSFGNDNACDWADGLEEVNDLSLVEDTINAVLALGNEYVEAVRSFVERINSYGVSSNS